jgi:O-antigen/teichoic acid export membrane protein
MNTRRSFIRGGTLLSASQALTLSLAFVRNVILVRMLSVEDMGVAALLGLTVALFDMMSDLNLGTMLIQADDGDDPELQATGHSIMFIRAVGSAALLLVLAWPMAALFGVPEARWAFVVLALIPLLKGISNLDLARLQRQMDFRAVVTVDVASQVLLLVVAWPLARWFKSYTAILGILILQAALYAIGSHLVARRRFSVAWHRQSGARMISFGWPLLVNGLLMFCIFQGDRFIIGAAQRLFPSTGYSLTDLGVYSVAFALALLPVTALAKVGSSLFLPILSQVKHDTCRFERRYRLCLQVACLTSALFAGTMLVLGDRLILGLYGQKYKAATEFFGLLVVMQAIRMIRVAPTLAAISRGDTRNGMFANIARASALVAVCVAAAVHADLRWIAAAGIAGEVLALGCSLAGLRSRWNFSYGLSTSSIVVTVTAIGVCLLLLLAGFLPTSLGPDVVITAALDIALAAGVLCVSPQLCFEIREAIFKRIAPSPSPVPVPPINT